MTPEMRDRLSPLRDMAIEQGIPAEEVERWLDSARPCATLSQGGYGGPVVGRFGGPLRLPADTPTPVFPFVASIDLAALPTDATDLPLPPDGHLLLFAFPDDDGDLVNIGAAVHVPADAATEERDTKSAFWHEIDEYREMVEAFPQGPLRATATASLPNHYGVKLPGTTRPLQIGGYASEETGGPGDPVSGAVECAVRMAEAGEWSGGGEVSGAVEDWALLADWNPGIKGTEGAVVHWAIQREELAARRFERTVATMFWNP